MDERPVFYYDLASPYSCLAAFRIDRVLPAAVWQPVWIAPILDAAGRDWRRPAAEGRERQAEIERRASAYGMPPWRWPEPYLAARRLGPEAPPINSLAVMRLATFAHAAGVGEEFARRAYHLAFGEGLDITAVGEQVIAAAVACRLDQHEARAAPGDPGVKQALREATDAAVARGVTGLPTIAAGKDLFWGDDRLADAGAALSR